MIQCKLNSWYKTVKVLCKLCKVADFSIPCYVSWSLLFDIYCTTHYFSRWDWKVSSCFLLRRLWICPGDALIPHDNMWQVWKNLVINISAKRQHFLEGHQSFSTFLSIRRIIKLITNTKVKFEFHLNNSLKVSLIKALLIELISSLFFLGTVKRFCKLLKWQEKWNLQR